MQVHCSFGLEAELAELLEKKADQIAQRLGRKWENICSEDGEEPGWTLFSLKTKIIQELSVVLFMFCPTREEQLILCLSMHLQCARLFLKGQRYQRHLIANERAALICLQLKAVQIHLAASLHEQQNAASPAQDVGVGF